MNVRLAVLMSISSVLCAFASSVSAREFESSREALEYMSPLLDQCSGQSLARLQSCLAIPGKTPFTCFDEIAETGLKVDDPREATNTQAFNQSVADSGPQGKLTETGLKDVRQLVGAVAADSPIPALNGTLDSFLPTLLPTLLQPFGDLEEPQTAGFSMTLPRFLWMQARVGGFVNPVPKINAALEGALRSRGQLELGPRATELDPGDDYYVTADITFLGSWFGREYSDHRNALSRLSRTAIVGRDVGDQSFDSAVYRNVGVTLGEDGYSDSESQKAAACAADIYNRIATKEQVRFDAVDVNEFWRFVNNQPQLIFSYRRLHRDEVVGADATTYRVRLTSGLLNNVTSLILLPGCKRGLGGDGCPKLYQNLRRWPTMTHGLGMSAYYEWGNLADIRVPLPLLPADGVPGLPLPLPGLPVALDGNDFFVSGGDFRRFGWTIGGSLQDPKLGENPTSIRLDGGVDYYRYDNDPARLDHHVARVTLTYRRGRFSIPLHLMYRTKTEFEADLGNDVVLGLGTQFALTQW